jgi:hypothetical protein
MAKYVIQIELKIVYKHINPHFLLRLFFHRPVIARVCVVRGAHNFTAQAHRACIVNVSLATSNNSLIMKVYVPSAQDARVEAG